MVNITGKVNHDCPGHEFFLMVSPTSGGMFQHHIGPFPDYDTAHDYAEGLSDFNVRITTLSEPEGAKPFYV